MATPWTALNISVLWYKCVKEENLILIDFDPIRTVWAGLSDGRIAEYGSVIPNEWSGAAGVVDSALSLIRDARDNIDACLAEVKRVLA